MGLVAWSFLAMMQGRKARIGREFLDLFSRRVWQTAIFQSMNKPRSAPFVDMACGWDSRPGRTFLKSIGQVSSAICASGKSRPAFVRILLRRSLPLLVPVLTTPCNSGRGFDVLHQKEKALGERGVNIHRAFQKRVWLICQHQRSENLHQLASFGG